MCRGFTGLFWRFRTLKHWKTTDTLKPTFANSIAVWNPVGTSRFGKATYTRTEGWKFMFFHKFLLKPAFYIPYMFYPLSSMRFYRVFVVFFVWCKYAVCKFPQDKKTKKTKKHFWKKTRNAKTEENTQFDVLGRWLSLAMDCVDSCLENWRWTRLKLKKINKKVKQILF